MNDYFYTVGKKLATSSACAINGHHTPKGSMKSSLSEDTGLRFLSLLFLVPDMENNKIFSFGMLKGFTEIHRSTFSGGHQSPDHRQLLIIFTS